jgi:hypothetical protein
MKSCQPLEKRRRVVVHDLELGNVEKKQIFGSDSELSPLLSGIRFDFTSE